MQYSIEGFIVRTPYEDGGEKVEIGEYEIHPDAAQFDLMTGDRFEQLCDSISRNGLRHKIKLDGAGLVVDGQNRLLACLAAGVPPEFETQEGDIRELIIDNNLMRRDMTPGQRVAILARLKPEASATELSQATGLDERTARKAKRVAKDAVPAVQESLEQGDISLHRANEIAQLPKEKQEELLGEFGSEERDRGNRGKKNITAAAVAAQKDPKPFVWEKWVDSAEKKLSKLVASAPEDQRDRAKGRLATVLNATVRLHVEDDTESEESLEALMLTPEGVIEKIDDMLSNLPKSERKEAEAMIRAKFPAESQQIKKAPDALEAIDAIRAGLSAAEQKKLDKLSSLGKEAESPANSEEPQADLQQEVKLQKVKKASEALEVIASVRKGLREGLSAAEQKKLDKLSGEAAETPQGGDWPQDPIEAAGALRQHVKTATAAVGALTFETDEAKQALVQAAENCEQQICKLLNETGALEDKGEVKFPVQLQTDGFRSLWSEWLQHRRMQKKLNTTKIQNLQLNQLSKFDEAQASEIVTLAVAQKWQGIPQYAKLAGDKWDGRPPAFDSSAPAAETGRNGKPTEKEAEKIARSRYGRFVDDPNDNRTPEEVERDAMNR